MNKVFENVENENEGDKLNRSQSREKNKKEKQQLKIVRLLEEGFMQREAEKRIK